MFSGTEQLQQRLYSATVIEYNVTKFNWTAVTTATISYIRGTSVTIARILQPYNIRVADETITTLRMLLTLNEKADKNELNDRAGADNKINCCN